MIFTTEADVRAVGPRAPLGAPLSRLAREMAGDHLPSIVFALSAISKADASLMLHDPRLAGGATTIS